MKTLLTTLALLSLSTFAQAGFEVTRCQTADGFAYWTPTACAAADRKSAVVVFADEDRNQFHAVAEKAERAWNGGQRGNRIVVQATPRRAKANGVRVNAALSETNIYSPLNEANLSTPASEMKVNVALSPTNIYSPRNEANLYGALSETNVYSPLNEANLYTPPSATKVAYYRDTRELSATNIYGALNEANH